MHRYSEIPNTPTPYSKHRTSPKLRIGTIVNIPNIGKAALRYVGPVAGKNGDFVGIELLGESASFGKNSGDVDGISYFKTNLSGAGLFMSLERFKDSAELNGSTPQRRHSLMSSNVKANLTPSLRDSSTTMKAYATPALTSAVRKSQINRTLSSPSSSALQSKSKSPASSKELQRLVSAKAVIESERDVLLEQVETLKNELNIVTVNFKSNKETIENLSLSLQEYQDKVKVLDEKATEAEEKLTKQRKAYEIQKAELLEVIDQVEAQVNDNETLYIGELKKLQDELVDKQQMIENLSIKQKELEEIHERQKLDIFNSEKESHLINQIENLKSTNLTQLNNITRLEEELKDKEKRIIELNTEGLALKELHIAENEELQTQISKYKSEIDELSVTVNLKEEDILKLKSDLGTWHQKEELMINNEEIEKKFKQEIEILQKDIKEKEYLESKVSELNSIIDELRSRDQDEYFSDKILQLEIQLENKNSQIGDLKLQLLDNINSQNNENEKALGALKDELQVVTIEELQEKVSLLAVEANKCSFLQQKLDENLATIKDQKVEIDELKENKVNSEKFSLQVYKKDEEIASINKLVDDLGAKLAMEKEEATICQSLLEAKEKEANELRTLNSTLRKDTILLDEFRNELDTIKSEKEMLLKAITNKDDEIENLTSKILGQEEMPQSETKSLNIEELLEEKNLEIDLLKEEILELKSHDSSKEFESLKHELEKLKIFNDPININELNEEITSLRKELESKPTLAEFKELKSDFDLIDELRKVESRTKDQEISELKAKLKAASERNGSFVQNSSPSVGIRTSMRPLSLNRPPVISQIVDGALQIYVPDSKKDPANGRRLWCGLCEREGHDSIDCPYDNEVF